jgi:hypothetical protein
MALGIGAASFLQRPFEKLRNDINMLPLTVTVDGC